MSQFLQMDIFFFVTTVVVIAIGYAGQADALASEKHRAQEREPRRRRPIAEFVFDGMWR